MFISKYECNYWNTSALVLNVMERVARQLDLNINNDNVSSILYDLCCDLESWPEGEGFGSSDSYSYVQRAKKHFEAASA